MKGYENFFEKNNSILDLITSDGFIYGIRRLGGQIVKVNPQFEKFFSPGGKDKKGKARFSKSILDIINHSSNDGVELNCPVIVPHSPNSSKYLVVKLPIIQDDTVFELIMLLDISKNKQLEQYWFKDNIRKTEGDLSKMINNLQNSVRLHEQEFVTKNSALNSSIIKLVGLIFKDSLTKLSNRRSFDEAVFREVHRYKRSQHNVALILLDLDEFKLLNDQFGHAIGDDIIVELSGLLTTHIRETDLVFRWGGDEFAIIMEVEPDLLETVLGKLRGIVAKHSFNNVNDKTVTISVGASVLNKADTVDSWFERSDQALYQSKSKGRDQVTLI